MSDDDQSISDSSLDQKNKLEGRYLKLRAKKKSKAIPNEWWEDTKIMVAYNSQKINNVLSQHMGSNVIKLANRKYISDLRNAVSLHFINEMNKRAKKRAAIEIERIRKLYFKRPNDTAVPDEIADHPIFKIRKSTRILADKRREKIIKIKKFKEADEKKKKRKYFEVLEPPKVRNYAEQEKLLQVKFKQEDSTKGTKLLRISNENWAECELDLKEFLEKEKENYLRYQRGAREGKMTSGRKLGTEPRKLVKRSKRSKAKSKDKENPPEFPDETLKVQPRRSRMSGVRRKRSKSRLSLVERSPVLTDPANQRLVQHITQNFEYVSQTSLTDQKKLSKGYESQSATDLIPKSDARKDIPRSGEATYKKYEDCRIKKFNNLESVYDIDQQAKEIILDGACEESVEEEEVVEKPKPRKKKK